MTYTSRLWEDVSEGEQLPPITYELSLLRMVALIRATGVYDYVHFDRDYAQTVGARDVFMATPHVAGMFGRLVTDWSGPEGVLRSLTFSMNRQSCSNDILKISGKVGRKYIDDDGQHLVDLVDLNIGHQREAHAATATATVALPSKSAGAVEQKTVPSGNTHTAPPADIPEFAREQMGITRVGKGEPARALTADEIHLWCECLEDWNPLYWDEEYAKSSRFGGLIAPPTGMFFGAGSSASMGIGYEKPGTSVPEPVKRGLTGMPLLRELRKGFVQEITPFFVPGCPEVAVVQLRADYYNPLRPGDSTHSELRLLGCSPRKRTKLGEGHFLTWENSLINQDQKRVKTSTLTMFYYQVTAA